MDVGKKAMSVIRDLLSKSFQKYAIVGIMKTALNLVLLFFFIDLLNPPVSIRWLVRLATFVFVAIITYYWYVWIGFAKKEEKWGE